MTTDIAPITIRPAYADDHLGLVRLAALDSAEEIPATPVLVAEVDGQLAVAISLRNGAVIADPFRRTAEIIELLRRHARNAHDERGPRRGRRTGLRRSRGLIAPRWSEA